MNGAVLEAVTEFIKLIAKAFDGDDEAMARVGDTLPHLRTKLIKARQDAADVAKFGPKPTEAP